MNEILLIGPEETKQNLPFNNLIQVLRKQFAKGTCVPLRHHYTIPLDNNPDATLLLMPSWNSCDFGGVKIVNVNPGNSDIGISALSASYLLFDSKTGHHLAMIDGGEITARRTAAASVLAASYLAKPESQSLLMVGTGRLAENLPYAYKTMFPIKKVSIWGPNFDKAQKLAHKLNDTGFEAVASHDISESISSADIISCATLSQESIIKGEWLLPGQHLDLIGSFTPQMREADDEAIKRSSVFIDTDAALSESGDIIDPMSRGILTQSQIKADLYDLCKNKHSGRESVEEITLFKAVGTALEDLAAATLAYENLTITKSKA